MERSATSPAKRSADPQLRSLTPLEGGILGLLARGGELSGWEVQKQARTSVAYFWPIGRSQVYAALPRLERGGLVASRDVQQQGKPDKRVFRLTRLGRKSLRAWLEEPDAQPPRDVFHLKLFFGAHADRSVMRARILERREAAQRLLDEIERMPERADIDDFFHALTRNWGRIAARCRIEWCDQALDALDALEMETAVR